MRDKGKEILTVEYTRDSETNDIVYADGSLEKAIKLSERSLEIDTKNQAAMMREIIHDIKSTMREKKIKHLSAPAIGHQRRIFCIDFEDLEIKTYINPIIAEAKGLVLAREEDPCFPGRTFLVPRNTEVSAIYQRPTGQTETRQFLGQAAIVFQQELNHLDGILLSDFGLEIDKDYDNATEEEKQEIVEMYLDALDLKGKELDKEIQEDKELKELSDGITFLEKVAKGEIKQQI